jgi:hypothetical protein
MSIYDESSMIRMSSYGIPVYRDANCLPESESYPLFNIVGGRVAITQIIGEVTEAIQNQANDTKLQATPTGGSAVDLCAALDIADMGIGTLFSITGTPTDPLADSSSLITPQAKHVILGEGTIDLDCAATNDGEIEWTVYYIALDQGAYVEAAAEYVTTEGE